MMVMRFFILLLAAFLLASCHGEPRSGRQPSPPSGGEDVRPPVTERDDFSAEVADGVWRVHGPAVKLRYDRGGVLFNRSADGLRHEIIDLDGASRVTLRYDALLADSTLGGAEVVIDGRPLSLGEVKMMARSGSTQWLRIEDAAGHIHVMVLPLQ